MKQNYFTIIFFITMFISVVNTELTLANDIGTVNFSGVTCTYCDVYNENGEYISKHLVKNTFELPIGIYVFSVNGSFKSVTVQTGQNEFPLGTVSVSAINQTDCYVFDFSDESGKLLSKHNAIYPFELFPGNYTLKVNGTSKKVNVQSGQNDFLLGNIDLKASNQTSCFVYASSDTSGNYLSEHNATNPFDLFPGNYTFKVNGTSKEVNVQPGQNDFLLGNIDLKASNQTSCFVYAPSDTSGNYLSEHNTYLY